MKSNMPYGTADLLPLLETKGYEVHYTVSGTHREVVARSTAPTNRPLPVYVRTIDSLIRKGTVVLDRDANPTTKVYKLAPKK
jgi:hypothetical protein